MEEIPSPEDGLKIFLKVHILGKFLIKKKIIGSSDGGWENIYKNVCIELRCCPKKTFKILLFFQ